MSRSNPVENNPHPCKLWLEWKGGPGILSYWDKNKGESGERVEMDVRKKPFRFIFLEQTCTVRGYSKAHKCGVYANEIPDRGTGDHPFTVKLFSDKATIVTGLWADIKDTVTSKRFGGGFAKNVYIAYKDGDKLAIGAIQMSGCALGPWIEFENANRKAIGEQGVVIGCGDKDDSGGVEFYPPTFGLCTITPESNLAAKKLDVDLQAHLQPYFAKADAMIRATPAISTEPEAGAGRRESGLSNEEIDAVAAAQEIEPPF